MTPNTVLVNRDHSLVEEPKLDKDSKRLQKSGIKVAEHSLLRCESLLFIGVLFKTRCRYKAQAFDLYHGNMDGRFETSLKL